MIAKILAIAAGEIGYSRWNDPEAGTKYGRYYANQLGEGSYFGTSGVPYCAMFVSWVFDQAGILSAIPGGAFAYVPYGINAARNGGRLVSKTSAQPGDVICFDWDGDGVADHVGIVEVNRGSYVQTIEGNTSPGTSGSQSNGGGVYRRARSWSDVCAVIRPAYDNASTASSTGIAVDGDIGPETIRALQRVLGTSVDGVISGQYAPNREYVPAAAGGWEWTSQGEGSQVIAALQRHLGVEVDGLIGPGTIQAWQRHLGVSADGYLGPQTAQAIQRRLNEGRI